MRIRIKEVIITSSLLSGCKENNEEDLNDRDDVFSFGVIHYKAQALAMWGEDNYFEEHEWLAGDIILN